MNTDNRLKKRWSKTNDENDSYNKNRVCEIKFWHNTTYTDQMGHKLKTSSSEYIRSYKYDTGNSNFTSHLIEEEMKSQNKWNIELPFARRKLLSCLQTCFNWNNSSFQVGEN